MAAGDRSGARRVGRRTVIIDSVRVQGMTLCGRCAQRAAGDASIVDKGGLVLEKMGFDFLSDGRRKASWKRYTCDVCGTVWRVEIDIQGPDDPPHRPRWMRES